jgi:hypothetical protein
MFAKQRLQSFLSVLCIDLQFSAISNMNPYSKAMANDVNVCEHVEMSDQLHTLAILLL